MKSIYYEEYWITITALLYLIGSAEKSKNTSEWAINIPPGLVKVMPGLACILLGGGWFFFFDSYRFSVMAIVPPDLK